jgi:L-amino acid N-acyltransferase YncA
VIRVGEARDASAIAEIYRPVVLDTAISFELEPPDADEMRSRMEQTLRTHPWLVHERNGRVAGYAYASVLRTRPAYRWSTETSVYVEPTQHGQGIGRSLYVALLAVLARQGFIAVFGGITLPNPASVRLHEALGFRPVGTFPHVGFKLGAWHDVGFWRRQLLDETLEPAEPVEFSSLNPSEVASILELAVSG